MYIYINHDQHYEQLASYFFKILVIDTAENLLLYIEFSNAVPNLSNH